MLSLPRVQRFFGSITDGSTVPYAIPWEVPKWTSFLCMICIGGGSGGGPGLGGASLTARGGGGGGATGAIARVIVPTAFLPRVLYLFPGWGGLGGVGNGNTGANGGRSQITDKASTYNGAVADTILVSGTAQSIGAHPGTAAGSDTGGTGETAGGVNLGPYQSLMSWKVIGGLFGQNAGALGAAGVNTATYGTGGMPMCEGAGGGSTNASNVTGAGGNVVGAGLTPTSFGGAAGSGGAGGNGIHGSRHAYPWVGGSGGGSGDTGIGGDGGNGAPGCGGGGGGGGITGGRGGNGGEGVIVLISW